MSGIQPIDKHDLWSVRIITDNKNGEIKVLIPMDSDLLPDPGRSQKFFATIIINTPRGPMQHQFEIEAKSLEAAIDLYPDAANQAGTDFVQGIKDAELRNNLLGKSEFPQPAKARITQ